MHSALMYWKLAEVIVGGRWYLLWPDTEGNEFELEHGPTEQRLQNREAT